MLKATQIKMHRGKHAHQNTQEIYCIYIVKDLDPIGWFTKEAIHDFLELNQHTDIYVDIPPRPKLKPAKNNSTRYVRSTSNNSPNDNLLKLTRKK